MLKAAHAKSPSVMTAASARVAISVGMRVRPLPAEASGCERSWIDRERARQGPIELGPSRPMQVADELRQPRLWKTDQLVAVDAALDTQSFFCPDGHLGREPMPRRIHRRADDCRELGIDQN